MRLWLNKEKTTKESRNKILKNSLPSTYAVDYFLRFKIIMAFIFVCVCSDHSAHPASKH